MNYYKFNYIFIGENYEKSIRWVSLIIVVIILVILGGHKITVRFLSKSNSAIQPDKSIKIINIPFSMNIKGFKLTQFYYSHKQHLIIGKYRLTNKPLAEVKKAKYIGVSFQPTTAPITNKTQTDPFILSRKYNCQYSGMDTVRILIGNHYNDYYVLQTNYPAKSVRDPSIMRDGNRYYIVYTRGLMYTNNFTQWHLLKWPRDHQFSYAQEWAPEFVRSSDNKHYIVMSAALKGKPNQHSLYLTTFKNEHIGKIWRPLNGNFPTNSIDPDIRYYHHQYYLFFKNEKTRRLLMGVSKKLIGPYQMKQIKADFSKFDAVEGPSVLFIHNKAILFFDTYDIQHGTAVFHDLHYIKGNPATNKWGKVKEVKSNTLLRHGQFIVN